MLVTTIEMSETSVCLEIDSFCVISFGIVLCFGNWLLAGCLLVNASKIETRDCLYRSGYSVILLSRKLALHSLYWIWLFLT